MHCIAEHPEGPSGLIPRTFRLINDMSICIACHRQNRPCPGHCQPQNRTVMRRARERETLVAIVRNATQTHLSGPHVRWPRYSWSHQFRYSQGRQSTLFEEESSGFKPQLKSFSLLRHYQFVTVIVSLAFATIEPMHSDNGKKK